MVTTHKSSPQNASADVVPQIPQAREHLGGVAISDELLQLIVDNIDAHIYIKDALGAYVYANPKVQSLYNKPQADIIGKTAYDFHARDIADSLADIDRRVLVTGEKVALLEKISDAQGNLKSYWSVKLPLRRPGLPDCLLGLSLDVTEQVLARDLNAFRGHILELMARGNSLDDVLLALAQGIEAIHPGLLCSILLPDPSGKRFERVIAPSLPDYFNAAIPGLSIEVGMGSCGTAAATGQRFVASDLLVHPYWEQFRDLVERSGLRSCWSQPIVSSKNSVLGTFAIYRRESGVPADSDISLIEGCANLTSIAIEKDRAEEAIREYAFCDSLTGLPNRRLLADRLAIARASSQRSGQHGAVLWLDLDQFKPLNDTHGHDAGDLLLMELADRLTTSVRETDTVARVGGDEFVVVLPSLGPDAPAACRAALARAESLRQIIDQPFDITLRAPQGGELRVVHHCTVSIGVALFHGDTPSDAEILKRADEAMYDAKDGGRNRVKLYSGH